MLEGYTLWWLQFVKDLHHGVHAFSHIAFLNLQANTSWNFLQMYWMQNALPPHPHLIVHKSFFWSKQDFFLSNGLVYWYGDSMSLHEIIDTLSNYSVKVNTIELLATAHTYWILQFFWLFIFCKCILDSYPAQKRKKTLKHITNKFHYFQFCH